MEINIVDERADVFEKKLFFFIGLTSTWTILQVPIFGIQISLFNLVIIFAACYHFIKHNNTRLYINDLAFFLFILGTVVSFFSAFIFLGKNWYSESMKATLKFLMIFFPLLCFYKKDEICRQGSHFLRGLYYSCVVQLFWSYLQLIYWYGMHRLLNKEFFGDFLHIQIPGEWLVFHSIFRTTGLSWESANLGISLVVGFFLSSNVWMKVLFLMGLIFSGSRSALLTLIGAIFIVFIYKKLSNKSDNHIKKLNKKIFLIIPLMIIILLIIFKYANLQVFYDTFTVLIERIRRGFSGNDSSADRHMEYYTKLPIVLVNSNIFQVLFGYGTSCSGYPYAKLFNFYNSDGNLSFVWNVESDVVTVLIGNGIFGFITYYVFAIKMIIKNKNRSNDQMAAAVSLVLAGIMYLYLRTWVTLLIMFLAMGIEFEKKSKIDKAAPKEVSNLFYKWRMQL